MKITHSSFALAAAAAMFFVAGCSSPQQPVVEKSQKDDIITAPVDPAAAPTTTSTTTTPPTTAPATTGTPAATVKPPTTTSPAAPAATAPKFTGREYSLLVDFSLSGWKDLQEASKVPGKNPIQICALNLFSGLFRKNTLIEATSFVNIVQPLIKPTVFETDDQIISIAKGVVSSSPSQDHGTFALPIVNHMIEHCQAEPNRLFTFLVYTDGRWDDYEDTSDPRIAKNPTALKTVLGRHSAVDNAILTLSTLPNFGGLVVAGITSDGHWRKITDDMIKPLGFKATTLGSLDAIRGSLDYRHNVLKEKDLK